MQESGTSAGDPFSISSCFVLSSSEPSLVFRANYKCPLNLGFNMGNISCLWAKGIPTDVLTSKR